MRRVRNHLAQKMGSAAREGTATGLVGRDHECAVVDALLNGALDGESGALVLRAEAGTGKTSLLDTPPIARTRSRSWGHRRRGGVRPRLLRAAQPGAADPRVAPAVCPSPQRAALAAALGLASGDGADRFLVSAGVLSLLAAAAEERPVLCLADDAQWLDVPSAASLVFTARRLGAEGLVILFAAREGERRRFEAPGLAELVLLGLDSESAAESARPSASGAGAVGA